MNFLYIYEFHYNIPYYFEQIQKNNKGQAAMEKYKHFLLYQFPAISWATIIFIQSSLSSIPTPDLGFDFQDKFLHAIVYGILGFLLLRALIFQNNRVISRYAAVLTILIGGFYAMTDEIHQSFVPGRYADFDDGIADIIGILTVVFIVYAGKINKRWERRKAFIDSDRGVS